METKTKKRKKPSTKPRKSGWKSTLIQAGGVIGGFAIGTTITNALTKEAQKVEGLKGTASNYLPAAIATTVGIVGTSQVDNKILKSVALGVTTAGAVKMLNEVAGKPIVSLGNVETSAEQKTLHPGMGRIPYIPQPLPHNGQEKTLPEQGSPLFTEKPFV